jgi:hypothetical protein
MGVQKSSLLGAGNKMEHQGLSLPGVVRVVVQEWSLGGGSGEEQAGETVSCLLVKVVQGGAAVSSVFEQRQSSPSVAEKRSTVTSKDNGSVVALLLGVNGGKGTSRSSSCLCQCWCRTVEQSSACATRKELQQLPFLLQ